MGLDKVIGRIENEGAEEIGRIEAEAESHAKEIIGNARKTARELAEKRMQEATRQALSLSLQEESSAELEVKKIRLTAQKEVLDRTYRECMDALSALPHDKIVSLLIVKAKREMPEAVFAYSNKRDEQAVRSVSGLAFAGVIDCIGGVILENREKTMRLDYRYETIAAAVWEKNLKDIADRLFK